jgi:hypothetical protein
MDKKAKKRCEVIKKKVEQLRQRLAGAKQQPDDPNEVIQLQAEIGRLEAEGIHAFMADAYLAHALGETSIVVRMRPEHWLSNDQTAAWAAIRPAAVAT